MRFTKRWERWVCINSPFPLSIFPSLLLFTLITAATAWVIWMFAELYHLGHAWFASVTVHLEGGGLRMKLCWSGDDTANWWTDNSSLTWARPKFILFWQKPHSRFLLFLLCSLVGLIWRFFAGLCVRCPLGAFLDGIFLWFLADSVISDTFWTIGVSHRAECDAPFPHSPFSTSVKGLEWVILGPCLFLMAILSFGVEAFACCGRV